MILNLDYLQLLKKHYKQICLITVRIDLFLAGGSPDRAGEKSEMWCSYYFIFLPPTDLCHNHVLENPHYGIHQNLCQDPRDLGDLG